MDHNQRNIPREQCFARVVLRDIPGQLRDINDTGIKIVLIEEIPLNTGDETTVEIQPDETLNISDFKVTGEVKWLKKDPFGQLIGIQTEDFPTPELEKSFKELLNYYSGSDN